MCEVKRDGSTTPPSGFHHDIPLALTLPLMPALALLSQLQSQPKEESLYHMLRLQDLLPATRMLQGPKASRYQGIYNQLTDLDVGRDTLRQLEQFTLVSSRGPVPQLEQFICICR